MYTIRTRNPDGSVREKYEPDYASARSAYIKELLAAPLGAIIEVPEMLRLWSWVDDKEPQRPQSRPYAAYLGRALLGQYETYRAACRAARDAVGGSAREYDAPSHRAIVAYTDGSTIAWVE
jgi:hypothetical protein